MAKKSQSKPAINLSESGNSGYAQKAGQEARRRHTPRGASTTYYTDSAKVSGFYTAGTGKKKLKDDLYRGYQDFKPKETYKSKMGKRKPKRAR